MRLTGSLCAMTLLLLLGCGASIDVTTDWDPEANFDNLRTYQFAERLSTEDDDPRVYNETTMERIRIALNTALSAMGYELTAGGEPDFEVGWHGAINRKMSIETVDNNYDYHSEHWYSVHDPRSGRVKTYVDEWDEGTLIIDIIDPRKNELMWRGVGVALIEENVTPGRDQANLNDAVAQILKDFPPKK